MEAQMEIQNYLDQGNAELAQGNAREAAIAFAKGAQLEPDSPAVHLGLAEANLALGNNSFVRTASREVLALQPKSGYEAKVAQSLLDLLDHRYERALHNVDAAINEDPSIAYAHALRSHLLRANGQDYDASLARARATRLSYGGRFENCFPPLEPAPVPKKAYSADSGLLSTASKIESSVGNENESVPNWSRPGAVQRQTIRSRFFLSQNPGFVTNTIISLILVLYFLSSMNVYIYAYGMFSVDALKQIWRFVTSLFMYLPDPTHNLLSVLISIFSLFFIGREVEKFCGPYRYLGIYLLTGILCNVAYLVMAFSGVPQPQLGVVIVFSVPQLQLGLGPAGSLMGVFGAIGLIFFTNRRRLGGFGSSAITSWLFWLILNLVFAGSPLAVGIELFCILVGMIVAYFLLPRSGRGRSS